MAKKPQKKIAKPAKSGSTSKAASKPVSKGAKVVKPAPKPVAKSKPVVKGKPVVKSKPVAKKVAPAKKAPAKAPVKSVKKAPTKTPVATKKKVPAVTAKKISPSVKDTSKKTIKKPAPKAKAPVKPAPAPKAVAAAKPKAKAVVAPVKKAEPKAAVAPAKKEVAPKVVAKPAAKAEPVKAVKAVKAAPVNLIPSAKVTKGPIIDTMPEVVIKRAYDPAKMPPFIKKQRQRLIELRSALLDSMDMVTSDGLRNRAEGSEASVGGMHMADAGSDCYDRDFALSMLSKEQDAVYEINEALERVDAGVYGVCELSAKKISDERLEALPYTRYTREMQEQIERDQRGGSSRRPVVRSVFGLDDDKEDEEGADDEPRPSASESSLDFMKE